jgi:hypothetical protein
MKEIISAVLFIVSLYSGTIALKNIHKMIQKATLERTKQGLPSLTEMNKSFRNHSPGNTPMRSKLPLVEDRDSVQ